MTTTNIPEKTWAEIDALREQLNREVIARRQTKLSGITAEDLYVYSLGNAGTRLRVFVDAQGRVIE